MRRLLALGLAVAALGGCASAPRKTYMNGINHCYLCAVRVARSNGYQIREQDFHVGKGTLVAARSTPDPRQTRISRGWFKRTREVIWNMWERHEFEFWDEDMAGGRTRSEERVTASFKARSGSAFSWLGVGKDDRTVVKIAVDNTDFGREEWVIRRMEAPPEIRERMFRGLADCLGLATPTLYTARSTLPAAQAPAVASVSTLPPAAPLVPAVLPVPPPVVVAAPPAATVAEAAGSATLVAASTGGTATALQAAAPAQHTIQAPPIAEAQLAKGKSAYEAGKFAEAIPPLEKAVAGDPESAEALVYLAASYYQLKRLDDAIHAYEKYVELAPNDLASKDFLGEIRREKAGVH